MFCWLLTSLIITVLLAGCGSPGGTVAPTQVLVEATPAPPSETPGPPIATRTRPPNPPITSPTPFLFLPALPEGIGSNACPGTQPSMLMPGRQGRASNATPDSNRVRAEASGESPIVGEIAAGAYFRVSAGPICADGAAWFQVRSETGVEGWMMEGTSTEYWVMPIVADAKIISGPALSISLAGLRLSPPAQFGNEVESQDLPYDPSSRRPPVTQVRLPGYPLYDGTPGIYIYPVKDFLYYRSDQRPLLEEIRNAINILLANPEAKVALPPLRDSFLADQVYPLKAGPYYRGRGMRAIAVQSPAEGAEARPYYVFFGFSEDMQYLVYAKLSLELGSGELADAAEGDFQPVVDLIDTLLGLRIATEPAVMADAAMATRTPASSSPGALPGEADHIDARGVPMMMVPAGEFTMGSEESQDAQPVHTVYLDAYYIDQYEVTNSRYKACVDAGVCDPPKETNSQTRASYYGNPEFDDYPVIHVDWYQAKTHCEWRGAGLPTEAQWEEAARGADARSYPWGDEFDGSLANFCDVTCPLDWADTLSDDGHFDTAPVGSYEGGVSPFGAYDLAGNVWEWLNSQPVGYPYDPDDGRESEELTFGTARGIRGGGFDNEQYQLMATHRGAAEPSGIGVSLGFRCAREAAP